MKINQLFKFLSTISNQLRSNLSKKNGFASAAPAAASIKYEDVLKIREKHLSPTLIPYFKQPLMMVKGEKQWMWDQAGVKYLDLFAGIVTVSVGHCHPKVTNAAIEQMKTLWHTTSIYLTPPIHRYAERLTSLLPKELSVCYFVNSGSEASDMAITLARLHTGRFDIISLRNGYHGLTNLVQGIVGMSTWRHAVPSSGFHQTLNPNVYRGVWGGKNCRDSPVQTDRDCNCAAGGQCIANEMYVEQLDDLLRHSTPKTGVAGFIAESIQGGGGIVQYPRQFLKQAFEKIRERGGVCISDEVQTGFGRTGKHFWGFEAHDVVPEIVTMAKGIGNGFPLAAVVTTPQIAKSLSKATFFNTFGGNPIACTVGHAVLDVIEEEQLQKNADEVGTYMLQKLADLKTKHKNIGDVRGKGLMIGVEMVDDKRTRQPLNVDKMAQLFEAIKDNQVLVGKGGLYGNVIRIQPPLCITKENVDQGVDAIDKALKIL